MNRNYTADGLNRYSASGSVNPTYDARGNLTGDGVRSFGYVSDNSLVSAYPHSLGYDPVGRLVQMDVTGGAIERYAYDGDQLIAEYDGNNAVTRRYVFGPGLDEPLVAYEGSGTGNRSYMHADERGSVIALSNGSGAVTSVNAYDEYGIPASGNTGRFQYTGLMWLPSAGLQYSRNRFYSPTMGRFMQTDPIGVEGGINLYGYVRNDPANLRDPFGLQDEGSDVTVWGPNCDEGLLWDNDPRSRCWTPVTASPRVFWNPGGPGTTGAGTEAPAPPICRGVTRNGSNISVATPMSFYYGDYSPTHTPPTTPASEQDAAYFIGLANNGRWNGQFGIFNIDMNLSSAANGFPVNIGNPRLGGDVANPNIMFLSTPRNPAVDGLYVDHALGHSFGNILHSEELPDYFIGQPGNIMDANPGKAVPRDVQLRHVVRFLEACR